MAVCDPCPGVSWGYGALVEDRYFVVVVLYCELWDKIPDCLHLGKNFLQLRTFFSFFSPPIPSLFQAISVSFSVL